MKKKYITVKHPKEIESAVFYTALFEADIENAGEIMNEIADAAKADMDEVQIEADPVEVAGALCDYFEDRIFIAKSKRQKAAIRREWHEYMRLLGFGSIFRFVYMPYAAGFLE